MSVGIAIDGLQGVVGCIEERNDRTWIMLIDRKVGDIESEVTVMWMPSHCGIQRNDVIILLKTGPLVTWKTSIAKIKARP